MLGKMASEIEADALGTAGNLEEASSLERRSLESVAEMDTPAAEVDTAAVVAALMFALCFRFFWFSSSSESLKHERRSRRTIIIVLIELNLELKSLLTNS